MRLIRHLARRIAELGRGLAGLLEAGIDRAASGAAVVAANIKGMRSGFEETGQAAAQLKSSAGDMTEKAHQFKVTVEHFLRSVSGT